MNETAKPSANSGEVISTADVDKVMITLMNTTGNWDIVNPFLPYMSSEAVSKLANAKTNSYAKQYLGKGAEPFSKQPVTRAFVDSCALTTINNSANWAYVKPLFPYMTANGVQEVVTVYLSRTHNYETAQEAAAYMSIDPSNMNAGTVYHAGSPEAIDYALLPYMSKDEVDKLALKYISETGKFNQIYNIIEFMSDKGVDNAVTAYLKKNGDYGIVGAALQFMSKDGSYTLAKQYFANKTNNDYDWIYSPYMK